MGNSASSLPYTIGKPVATTADGWTLHDGTSNANQRAVSVFCAKKPALTKANLLEPALHHFLTGKKLRHPHILKVLATLDTDHPNDATGGGAATGAAAAATASSSGAAAPSLSKAETGDLMIVTEPCVPFETWLQTSPPPEQMAWGLECLIRGLHFMHASASLMHANVHPAAFFVTLAGDVKVWSFAVCTDPTLNAVFTKYEAKITPAPYRSPERQSQQYDALRTNGLHAADSYGVGVLIDAMYHGHIPGPLVKAVQRLQTPNVKMRPRLQPLLKCPLFDTPYQKLQLQLEEFAIAPIDYKIQFWQNLTPQLQAGLVPPALATYKLLPLMLQTMETTCNSDALRSQDGYRREISAMLQPMFYIGENYLGDTFGKELTITIGMLFTVNDRGIRGALLQRGQLLAARLTKASLNQAVFEPLCSGFSDSSAALRELTLKASFHMVPSLTQPNIEKLSRYLVRLQADPEPPIRTNTVIFFSKLAPHMSEMSRQKLLLPAFARGMKDPFQPCRLASLQGTLQAKEYFDASGVAAKVLPCVAPCLVDPATDVRKQAFSVVEDLLFVLRQESERLSRLPEANGAAGGGAPLSSSQSSATTAHPSPAKKTMAAAPPPAPASGGYLTGITGWMTSTAKPSDNAIAPASAPPASAPLARASAHSMSHHSAQSATMNNNNMASLSFHDVTASSFDNDDDAWGDDIDDDLDVSAPGTKTAPVSAPVRTTAQAAAAATNNSLFAPTADDDFFGAFDAQPARPAVMAKKSTGGKLIVPKKGGTTSKAPVLAATKLQADDMSDHWDDF